MKYIIFYFDLTASKIFVEKTDENGNTSTVLSSHNNFLAKNEIAAKIVEVDETEELNSHLDEGYNFHVYHKYVPLKSGDGIIYDPNLNIFTATEYGFAKYDKDKSSISLLSPLRIQKDKMKAFYIIQPTKIKKIPSIEEIEENLVKLRIFTMVDKNTLSREFEKIDLNKQELHKIIVAQGKEAVDGYNEYFIPLIDFEKKAGKILEDGSIDFKEIGSIVEIKQRQAILKKIPAQKTEDGFNIYGEKAAGKMTTPLGYLVGDNIVVSKDPDIYTSTIDGCLEVTGKTVSVSPISVVKGDISYESGNIDFHGTIHIRGSVFPGFTVKAKGDIRIGGTVTDAIVEAGGDVIVKLGIEGKGLTRVTAGGKVNSKFILNSKVEAMGIIQVEDSIINSNVFSNDKIIVTDKHGKIIGGETTALYEIHAKISGVPNENKTMLSVGKNILIEKELTEIRNTMKPVRDKIEEVTQKLKSGFGEEVFSKPKEFIAILPAVKKKTCLALLSELSSQNKELKKLLEAYKAKEDELKFDHEPNIQIMNKVFPGTLIKIKNSLRLIEEELHNVKFYEDAEAKAIRFTAVV